MNKVHPVIVKFVLQDILNKLYRVSVKNVLIRILNSKKESLFLGFANNQIKVIIIQNFNFSKK
jgi:hypothetical protein